MRSLIAGLICLVALNAVEAQRRYVQPAYQPAVQPAQAAPPVSKLDEKKDGHVGYNSGEVAELPQDADKLYLTIVLADDWANGQNEIAKSSARMKSWFETDPRLIKYRKESHFRCMTQSDPAFFGSRTLEDGTATSLYAKLGDKFPICSVTKPNGEMVFKCSALSLPKNAGEMADRITLAFQSQEKKAPLFEGLSQLTPFVTEGAVEQCGPDGCPPITPPSQHDKSEVLEDTPPPMTVSWGAVSVLAAFGVTAAGVCYVAYKRPGIKTK